MVFLKKIPKKEEENDDLDEKRNRFISSGGLVQADVEEEESEEFEWVKMHVRIPQPMIDDIESLIDRRFGDTRTRFVLQAISEKIDREKDYE